LISLTALSTGATNTLREPTKIVPVNGSIRGVSTDFHHTFPSYSISVIELDTK